MTVWHDQPPLSRRRVRENSPADLDEGIIEEEPATGENPPRRSAGRRVQWDPSVETPAVEAAPVAEAAPDAEPAPDAEVAPATEPAPAEENPAGYRVRDYRPDIRRAAFAPLATAAPQDPWTPPADASGTIGVAERASLPTELAAPEYTMTRRALRELRQRAEAAGQEAPNVVRDANGVLALTGSIPVIDLPRDEDGNVVDEPLPSAEANPDSLEQPVDDQPADEQPAGEQPASEHPVEPVHERIPVEVIVAEQALASAIIDEATISEATISEATIIEVEPIDEIDADDLDDFNGDTLISAPAPVDGSLGDRFDGTFEPDIDTVHALIDPGTQADPQPESLSPFDSLFLPPSSGAPVTPAPTPAPPLLEHDGGRGVEPAPDAAPYGHWSTQTSLDDASQSNEALLSRNVGITTGAITTHALVLPSGPSSSDQLLSPVTATGEIMVTGSIDLPRSFGSTGAHPALFDHPDVDALIDESDREDAASESAPVRAIRAVSSNSSTRGVIEAPAPRKSRLPLIAGITGGSALLVAAGVVAAGFIFNVF